MATSQLTSSSLVLNGTNTLTYTNLSAETTADGFKNLTVGQSGNTTTLRSNITIRTKLTIGTGELTTDNDSEVFLKGASPLTFNAASTLSIATLNFADSATQQTIPALSNGYDCNIRSYSTDNSVIQGGDIVLNSDKNLYIDAHNMTGYAVTWATSGYDLTVGGSITVGAGNDTAVKTLNASGSAGRTSTITISGDLTIYDTGSAPSVFTAGDSKVAFNDASKVSHVYGTEFNDLEITTPGKEVQFEAGSTETINGDFTSTGIAGNLVKLRSTTTGTQWNIEPLGTVDISYTDVKDSNNITNVYIFPYGSDLKGCVDSLNNLYWFDTTPPPTPPSPTPDTPKPNPPEPIVPPTRPDPDKPPDDIPPDTEPTPPSPETPGPRKHDPGSYRTTVSCSSGAVCVKVLDESGVPCTECVMITPGMKIAVDGEIRKKPTKTEHSKKYIVTIRVPADSKGEFVVMPIGKKGSEERRTIVLTPGSSFVDTIITDISKEN